jgi:hypothetical protein
LWLFLEVGGNLPWYREIDRGFGAFIEILPGKDGLLHISEVIGLVTKPGWPNERRRQD